MLLRYVCGVAILASFCCIIFRGPFAEPYPALPDQPDLPADVFAPVTEEEALAAREAMQRLLDAVPRMPPRVNVAGK